MKIEIERNGFADALKNVSLAVKKNSLLNGIKMAAKDSSLTLTGSDGEMVIKVVVNEVKVEEEGEILVDSEYLNEIVKKMDSESVSIITNDSNVLFKGGKAKYNIALMESVN